MKHEQYEPASKLYIYMQVLQKNEDRKLQSREPFFSPVNITGKNANLLSTHMHVYWDVNFVVSVDNFIVIQELFEPGACRAHVRLVS